jgi:hypothetical protein
MVITEVKNMVAKITTKGERVTYTVQAELELVPDQKLV